MNIILIILLFVLLIFPHELGHFVMAKLCNVQVNEFALGMGPAIWQKKWGETLYSIRLIPIGGYCKMEGEDFKEDTLEETDHSKDNKDIKNQKNSDTGNLVIDGANLDSEIYNSNIDSKIDEKYNPRSFNNKAWWQKILVLVAGAMMNVLIAMIMITAAIGITGYGSNIVATVEPGSPAAKAGISPNERIVKINNQKIEYISDVQKIVNKEKSYKVELEKGDKKIVKNITPIKTKEGYYLLGIGAKLERNPLVIVEKGVVGTFTMIKKMAVAIGNLFTLKGLNNVSGPVAMVSIVNKAVNQGASYYLYLVGLISLNLAVFNLLPLPALDGGRILFVIIRKITGKAITDTMENTVHAIGMLLLFGLMILVTWKDIVKLF